jgi:hypothetical protein
MSELVIFLAIVFLLPVLAVWFGVDSRATR